jgi:hypothetical protein
MEKHQPTQQWYVAPKCAALSDGNQVRINILINDYYADDGTPDDSAHRTERTHPFQLSDQLYSNPIALFLPAKAIRGKLRAIPAFLNPLTHTHKGGIYRNKIDTQYLVLFGSGYARILFPLTESNLSCSVKKVHIESGTKKYRQFK